MVRGHHLEQAVTIRVTTIDWIDESRNESTIIDQSLPKWNGLIYPVTTGALNQLIIGAKVRCRIMGEETAAELRQVKVFFVK